VISAGDWLASWSTPGGWVISDDRSQDTISTVFLVHHSPIQLLSLNLKKFGFYKLNFKFDKKTNLTCLILTTL